MADQSLRLGGATLTRFAEIVHTALIEMRGTTVAAARPRAAVRADDAARRRSDSAALLQRLERLERRLTAGADDAPPAPAAHRRSASAGTRCRSRRRPRRAAGSRCQAARRRSVRPAAARRPGGPPQRGSSLATRPAAADAPAQHAEPSGDRPAESAPAGRDDAAAAAAPAAPAAPAPGAPGSWTPRRCAGCGRRSSSVVKVASRRTRALLDNAQVHRRRRRDVTLSAPGALAKMIAEDSNTTVLQRGAHGVVGGEWLIAVDDAAAGGRRRTGQRAARRRRTGSARRRRLRAARAAAPGRPGGRSDQTRDGRVRRTPGRELTGRPVRRAAAVTSASRHAVHRCRRHFPAVRRGTPGSRPRPPRRSARRPAADVCSAASPLLRMLPSSRNVAGFVARFSPARSER